MVVILGTAGIVVGWQGYDAYRANQAAAKSLCLQGGGACSPFYYTNPNFFIKGIYNQSILTMPANCPPISCRVYSLNFTVSHPERLLMVYRAPVATYAELDSLAPTGQWVGGMYSPAAISGFIDESVACNFGTFRYWFSAGVNNTQYSFTVDVQIVSINYTGPCG